jgi:hypothetical protein
MIFSTLFSTLLAGSAAAAPFDITVGSSLQSRDNKPDPSDSFFASCYNSPDCDVIWSDNLQTWHTNFTNYGVAMSRADFENGGHLQKRGESVTKVRLGDSKTFFGDAWPSDVINHCLYDRCDNWGCIGSAAFQVFTARVKQSNVAATDHRANVNINCEGGWSDNWDMRNNLVELVKEAYNQEVQQEEAGEWCNTQNSNGISYFTCYERINKFYHSDLVIVNNYGPDGGPMGDFTCRISGVPEDNTGNGMCGFFWQLGLTLTGFIPTLGPYAAAMLGSVPQDGICKN